MSYPVGWDLVNITGTYIGRNGVPCVGSVTLSSPQLVLRSGTIVPAADIVFDLVNGVFSGQIPATDDPNAQPSGWVYTVTENVPGGRQGYQIVAPHTSPGIDLSTVVPVTMPMPPTFGFPYVTLSQLAGTVVGDGAYLIGYQLNVSGSVSQTVQSKLSKSISVTDFSGVDPSGATDSTAGLQVAINYAVSNGHSLFIPAGTYIVSSSLTNSLSAGALIIEGDNRNQATIKATGSTPFITLSLGSATYTSNEVLIQNVGFVNTQTITGYGWTSIYAQNVGHLAIRNSLISGGSRGIDVYAGYACDISDNLISGCYAEGIYLESAAGNGSRIVGNGVFGCGTGGAAGAVTAVSADNVLVSSNDIEGGYGGVFLSSCEGGRIASNFIEGQSNYNIYFASSTTGVAVRDNWLGVPGETIENCSNLQIKGNTFYNHHLVVNSATASGIDLCYNTVLGTSSIPSNYYITPTFSNGWVADTTGFGGFLMPPGYRKDSNNIVRIRGAIKSGTAALAFTLPVGYRPKANLVFCCSGYGLASPGATQVTVELSGNVSIAGVPANTSLDGIVFEAEA